MSTRLDACFPPTSERFRVVPLLLFFVCSGLLTWVLAGTGITSDREGAAAAADTASAPTADTSRCRDMSFPSVYFQRDSMALDREAQEQLDRLIPHLKDCIDMRVRLNGHVDERYSQNYGLLLSNKMAEVVKKYLLQHNVKNPIQIAAYGNARPICREHTQDCFRRSNRVDGLIYH